MPTTRSSILIRCTAEEAELIRQAAKNERRTVSGFILKVLLEYIGFILKVLLEYIARTAIETERRTA
jgi:uncharacterized protein (DUF1778 family)